MIPPTPPSLSAFVAPPEGDEIGVQPVAVRTRPPRGLGLRWQIHLIVAALMGLFVAVLIALQIDATRRSVHEEIVAGNRVAGQLLQRVGWIYTRAGPGALVEFLQQLGRVRANDIRLESDSGAEGIGRAHV